MKKRVFSGMRPTGRLHLGNYLGALDNWVQMQEDYQCVFGIVDYHALTSEYQNVARISENVIEVALDWFSGGIDPEKSIVMVQSLVPEHAELHLLLSMIVPLPWLERVPTYKEQIQQLRDRDLTTYGFLGYPLLQTADILIYKGEVVPVGEDQVAHIELSREIARRFNHFYAPVFPEPEARLTRAPRLPGTDGRKMSKSYGNEIQMAEPPREVRQKLMTMVTDPARVRRSDPGNPEICPVFDYHKIFSDPKTQEWSAHGCRTAEIGCVDCKSRAFQSMQPVIEPLYDKRQQLERDRPRVRDLLIEGSRKAAGIAAKTMKEVRQAMRIDYRP